MIGQVEYVDVMLLLPRRLDRAVYVYSVPPALQKDLAFGKRVRVPVGSQRHDGIILGPAVAAPARQCKAIIKILDREEVISPDLLELAEWMAWHYACSLAQVLRGIIPGFLRHRQEDCLVPLVQREDLLYMDSIETGFDLEEFMERLWDAGQESIKSARKSIGDEGIKQLEEAGWVASLQDYGYIRPREEAVLYKVRCADLNAIEALQKKAPRQADFLAILAASGSMPGEKAEKLASRRVIKALLEKGLLETELLTNEFIPEPAFELSSEQQDAVQILQAALMRSEYSEHLLFGITGSGKTEVYINLSLKALAENKSVLLLVPEIALTRQLLAMFTARIGDVVVMHSDMPARERYDTWMAIKNGSKRMVIGARSAAFAPLQDIGLIIIDEEQESSFKQEESPRYHVRDVARMRARQSSAMLLMGSATPSLESFHRAMNGQMRLLELKQRTGGGAEPKIILDDLRQDRNWERNDLIAPLLASKIRERLDSLEQVILFLNRRGFKPHTLCRSCGRSRNCPHCSVSLNYHLEMEAAICHYCGYQESPRPVCEFCGSTFMDMAGFGTQTVEEEARRMFPAARVARLDTDSSRRRGEQERILKAMKNGEIDILVGTQMVAKGLDFPMVSLVGVLGADQMLALPDFRAGERAFQLIVQAAGRAGRAKGGAEVVVQTYNPDSPVIQMAVKQDYFDFYLEEAGQRQVLNYPPFSSLLRVVLSSSNEDFCSKQIADIIEYADELTDARDEELVFLGPAACPIYRLRNRFRNQFIVRSCHEELLSSLGRYLAVMHLQDDLKLELDINPLNLM